MPVADGHVRDFWNDRLFEAVEADDGDLVRKLIAQGADPNARRHVHVSAQVRLGETDADGLEERTDEAPGISVLGAAILHGRAQAVAALAELGADPNAPVDWAKARDISDVCEEAEWARRWLRVCRYPSALHLALGKGGEVGEGGTNNWHSNWAHWLPWVEPRCDVVRALLKAGAKVDEDLLEDAGELANKTFVFMLHERFTGKPWPPPATRGMRPFGTRAAPVHRAFATEDRPASGASELGLRKGAAVQISRYLGDGMFEGIDVETSATGSFPGDLVQEHDPALPPPAVKSMYHPDGRPAGMGGPPPGVAEAAAAGMCPKFL